LQSLPHAIAHEQGTFKTASKPPTSVRTLPGRVFTKAIQFRHLHEKY
jgi:hypothetical protein